MNLDVKFEGC